MSYRININVLIRYPINIKPFICYLLIIIYYSFISNRMDVIISFCKHGVHLCKIILFFLNILNHSLYSQIINNRILFNMLHHVLKISL